VVPTVNLDQTRPRVKEQVYRSRIRTAAQKATEPEWESQMLAVRANPRVGLELIPTPSSDVRFVSAPPVLIASSHTIDYVCGKCSTVLLHAELGQVHGLIIHCTACGSYNSTDC